MGWMGWHPFRRLVCACWIVWCACASHVRLSRWLIRPRTTSLAAYQQVVFDPASNHFASVEEASAPEWNATDGADFPAESISLEAVRKMFASQQASGQERFSLRKAVPLLLQRDKWIMITEGSEPIPDASPLFVSEQELRERWQEASQQMFGKPVEQFTIPEALLLLEDEIAESEDQAGEEDNLFLAQLKQEDAESDHADSDQNEVLYVTEEELQSVWSTRARIPWGLPSSNFSLPEAFLLLDDPSDNIDDILPLSSPTPSKEADGDNSLLEQFPPSKRKNIQFHLEDMLAKLDHPHDGTHPLDAPPMRMRPSTMTPDFDAQPFIGDIMQTSPYDENALRREFQSDVPPPVRSVYEDGEATEEKEENEEGGEGDEAEEIVKEGGGDEKRAGQETFGELMTLPGEILEDFRIQPPLWKRLGKAFAPEDIPPALSLEARLLARGVFNSTWLEERKKMLQAMEESRLRKEQLPPLSLDLLAQRLVNKSHGLEHLEMTPQERQEIQAFHAQLPLHPDLADYVNYSDEKDFDRLPEESDDLDTHLRKLQGNSPEFGSFVGEEVWSQWEKVDIDNEVWDDDWTVAQCAQHVLNITDLFLRDHAEIRKLVDHKVAMKRYLNALGKQVVNETQSAGWKPSVSFPVLQEIPDYLTPDKHLGVEYTDELIEMKGMATLHPKRVDLDALAATNEFGFNEELITPNQVGTIREQYDWTPRKGIVHEIEEEKRAALLPVIKFAENIATLQSTRDSVIIFDYHGPVKHIIGMNSYLGYLAKKCLPDLVDFRLETPRRSDPGDF